MSIVINTKQLKSKDEYISGPCTLRQGCSARKAQVPCKAEDAVVGAKACGVGPLGNQACRAQLTCSKLDTSICPVIGGVTPSVQWTPGLPRGNSSQWSSASNLNVQCSYPAGTIKTVADLNTFNAAFSGNSNRSTIVDTNIMPAFCSIPSSTCGPDPETGAARTTCSRFSSTDAEGSLCRSWEARKPSAADTAKTNYCRSNPKATECRCINRATDPIYQQIAVRSNAPDSCWYLPCKNPDSYLVPSTIQLSTTCPNICQQINDFASNEGASLDVNELRQSINCQFNTSGASTAPATVPGKPATGRPTTTIPATTVSSVPAKGKSNIWLYIIIAVVALIIIVAIVVFFMYRRGSAVPVDETFTELGTYSAPIDEY